MMNDEIYRATLETLSHFVDVRDVILAVKAEGDNGTHVLVGGEPLETVSVVKDIVTVTAKRLGIEPDMLLCLMIESNKLQREYEKELGL